VGRAGAGIRSVPSGEGLGVEMFKNPGWSGRNGGRGRRVPVLVGGSPGIGGLGPGEVRESRQALKRDFIAGPARISR
jgi:hypothetical protein